MGNADSKLRSPKASGRDTGRSSNRSARRYKNDDPLIVKPGMFVQNQNSIFSENYKAIKILGKGSFGEVLLCCNRSTGMQCAVKVISKNNVKKTSDRESLLREIELLKELDHPHIMKLFEFFEDRGHYYLVTEYYSGGELFDEISSRKRFNEVDAAIIIKQLLNGINYMHKHSVVHRDLKPENLVLENKNDIKHIRIIDFGLSTHFHVDKKMKDRIGTAYYIAPEVLKGMYNEKCDIWSTGVILYILLSGYPPFNGPNENEIIKKVRVGKFSFSGHQWSRVSDGAKDLIEKMLSLNPHSRISAEKALIHPWLCKQTQEGPTNLPLLENTIKNIRSFHYTQRLAQAALLYIGSKLMSKDETRELTEIFKKMDKNGDGQIDRDELIAGYKDYAKLKKDVNFNENMIEEYVDNILLQIDFDKNGFIDYSEFITVAANHTSLTSNNKLEEAFKLFDVDKSGKISSKELAQVFGVSYLDPVVWKNILQQVDLNRDGEIDFIEFKTMLKKFR